MNKPQSGRLIFRPSSHHVRKADELVMYWAEEDDRRGEFDARTGITPLLAIADSRRITGVRIASFYKKYMRIPPPPEPPPSAPDRTKDNDPAVFLPYVWYDEQKDSVIVRWQAGAVKGEELVVGTRLTLLRDTQSVALRGVVLHHLSAIVRRPV